MKGNQNEISIILTSIFNLTFHHLLFVDGGNTKIESFSKSEKLFLRSIYNSKSQLISILAVTLFLLLFGAVILFFVEGPNQLKTFGSSSLAMCWLMATLTL